MFGLLLLWYQCQARTWLSRTSSVSMVWPSLQFYLFPPHLRDSKVSQGADHRIELRVSKVTAWVSVLIYRKVTVGEGGFELSPHPLQQCSMSQAHFWFWSTRMVWRSWTRKLNKHTYPIFEPYVLKATRTHTSVCRLGKSYVLHQESTKSREGETVSRHQWQGK